MQPDLVDPDRRIVLEADSFAWHGDRSSLRWDAQRYNNLVVRGWLVLRFAWEDVMQTPTTSVVLSRSWRRSWTRVERSATDTAG